jgi:hypothetical protein
MSVIAEVFAGLSGGVLTGVGKLARDLRAAITGEEAMTAEAKAAILAMAANLEQLALAGDIELQKAQIQLNQTEAQQGPFRGGWRPAAGWTCVLGLFYTFILRPILPWAFSLVSTNPVPAMPALETGELMALLSGMLGLGGYRMFERVRGKA